MAGPCRRESVRSGWAAGVELKPFDLSDTVADRQRMVERLDRRAVKEEIKTCGMPVLPEDVDAHTAAICGAVGIGEAWASTM